MKRILGLILILLVVALMPMAVSADGNGCSMDRSITNQTITLRVNILQDGVNSIGVTDTAPSEITSVNGGDFQKVIGNTVEAIWFGPYDTGDVLTLTYKVESLGWFTDGSVEYYVKGDGPYIYEIADEQVTRGWRYYLRRFSRYCRGRW